MNDQSTDVKRWLEGINHGGDIGHWDFLAPLAPYLADPEVSEIMVNGCDNVYLERQGKLVKVESLFRDDQHLLEVIQSIAGALGRRIDESSPTVDARLLDGSRVNAVVPPVSILGPALVIRKPARNPLMVEDLIRFGCWDEDVARFVHACIRARLNVVVGGGTGSGKTTLLNILSGMIAEGERIITIENAAELQFRQEWVVTLESRTPDGEGKGEVTVRDIVRNSLRMRPDRIVIGEVRAEEASDIIQAMNTGHDGSMFTIHASGPRDVIARLEMLLTSANPILPLLSVREQLAAGVDVIIYIRRMPDGSRKVMNVTEVRGMLGDTVVMEDIFVYRQMGRSEDGRIKGYHTATGATPKFMERLQAYGIDLPLEIFVPK